MYCIVEADTIMSWYIKYNLELFNTNGLTGLRMLQFKATFVSAVFSKKCKLEKFCLHVFFGVPRIFFKMLLTFDTKLEEW